MMTFENHTYWVQPPLASRQLYWILLRSHFPFSCWACYFFYPVIQLWCPPIVSLPLFGSYVTYQTGNPLPKFRCPFFFLEKKGARSFIY